MKNKGNKILSLKAQAVAELISAMIMVMLFIGKMYENIFHNRALHNIINYSSPLIIVLIVSAFVLMTRYKNQPNDELSRELTLRATEISVKVELIAAVAFGVIMHMQGNRRNIEYFSVMGSDVCMFGVFLVGVYFAAKNIVFLWLDRTPKAEEDE